MIFHISPTLHALWIQGAKFPRIYISHFAVHVCDVNFRGGVQLQHYLSSSASALVFLKGTWCVVAVPFLEFLRELGVGWVLPRVWSHGHLYQGSCAVGWHHLWGWFEERCITGHQERETFSLVGWLLVGCLLASQCFWQDLPQSCFFQRGSLRGLVSEMLPSCPCQVEWPKHGMMQLPPVEFMRLAQGKRRRIRTSKNRLASLASGWRWFTLQNLCY